MEQRRDAGHCLVETGGFRCTTERLALKIRRSPNLLPLLLPFFNLFLFYNKIYRLLLWIRSSHPPPTCGGWSGRGNTANAHICLAVATLSSNRVFSGHCKPSTHHLDRQLLKKMSKCGVCSVLKAGGPTGQTNHCRLLSTQIFTLWK